MELNPKLPERNPLKSKRNKRPLLICCFFFLWIIISSTVATVVVIYVNNKVTPKASANSDISSKGTLETRTSITKPMTSNTSIMKTKTSTPMAETTIKPTLMTQTTTVKTILSSTKESLISETPTTRETTLSMSTTPKTAMTTTLAPDISNKYKDCKELLNQGYTTTGVFTIYPYLPVARPVEVYCDMTTDGGGWTVFQHRLDGTVDFYVDWRKYKSGFGTAKGEHWLGNDHLHQLTLLGTSDFYVRLEKISGGWFYTKYKDFRIANERDGYRMRLKEGSYQGNADSNITLGDSIESHGTTNTNGHKFSTIDRDNDFAEASCAIARKGAWWHNICTWANLNGMYGNGNCLYAGNCNFWYSLTNSFGGVKTSFMMVRRI